MKQFFLEVQKRIVSQITNYAGSDAGYLWYYLFEEKELYLNYHMARKVKGDDWIQKIQNYDKFIANLYSTRTLVVVNKMALLVGHKALTAALTHLDIKENDKVSKRDLLAIREFCKNADFERFQI